MPTLSLTLSESQEEFVQAQVLEGGHASPHDYVLSLLQEAQQQEEWAKVKELVLEGLNSGPPVVADEAYWEERRRRLAEHIAQEGKRV